MRVPDSVAAAYEAELATVVVLQEFAQKRLRILCADNDWLFDDRLKSPESALSKLEAGTGTLADMVDLYAAMVVVPTLNEIEAARRAIGVKFTIEPKLRDTGKPSSFVYDDVHLVARLEGKVSPAGLPPDVLRRRFEIQIHTGVQYAWWRATHDTTYKGDIMSAHDWAVLRTVGQARASLELLDTVMSDFVAAAQLRPREIPQDDTFEAIAKWLDHWPKSRRPVDTVRFVSTTKRLIDASHLTVAEVEAALNTGAFGGVVSSPVISPTQAITILVCELRGDRLIELLKEGGLRVLITPEMIELRPGLVELPADIIVSIGSH